MGKVRFHPKIGTKYTYDKLLWPETHNGCTGCEDYWPDADYRALEADRDQWKDQVENPKMTYCAFCGQEYDLDDREKATELIVKHVLECEKHPYAALQAKLAALVKVSEAVREYLMGGIWVYDKSPDEFIKAALEASDGIENKEKHDG